MLNALVSLQVFETVEVGFLPVGHTHEDIDQGFSVLSRHLRKNAALSLSSYTATVRKAFSHRLDCPVIEYVNLKHDYKAWLEREGTLVPAKERVGKCQL